VVAAVELDHKASRRIVEVRPADEFAAVVVQVRLHLRDREPALDQQPAQTCLHRGLGWGGDRSQTSQPRRTRTAVSFVGIAEQGLLFDEPPRRRHVQRDQCVHT